MTAVWLENLAFYSLQIGVLAAAGALLIWLLRIRVPQVRLLCWQGLLALCLMLPAIQPWITSRENSGIQITIGPPKAAETSRSSRTLALPWETIALGVIGVGIAVRIGILALGFLRLRRYRRTSTAMHSQLAPRIAHGVDIRGSSEVSGPVTFGVLRPMILLPEACAGDDSVLFHELVHVRRRDWLFAVIEECVLSIFWFHPAMWWIISEIQLAREEAVDRETVAMLDSRELYLESLLKQAVARAERMLVPAAPFLRRRHLHRRIASLLSEVSMSRFRLTSSLTALAGVLALAAWMSVRAFPLQAAGQSGDSPDVTVHAGQLPLLHRAPVIYPSEALEKRVEGTVSLELNLNASGEVTDARVLSGPEELRAAAIRSVLGWHYAHDSQLPPTTQVSIEFKLPKEGSRTVMMAPPPDSMSRLDRLNISAPEAIRQKLESQITARVGDRITQTVLNEISAAMKSVDEHLKISLAPNQDHTGSVIAIWLDDAAPKKIRVGGNLQSTNLVEKISPVYPKEAKQNGIQGQVRLNVTISKDGKVENIEVASGDPILAQAARDAVAQWVYRPTLLNGNPVAVVTTVDVNFTLSK